MTNNKLIVAAAGSGKTTFLINEALKQQNAKILITTYTEANEAEIKARMSNQLPEEEKAKLADFVIKNNSDLLALKEQVLKIHEQLLAETK